MRTILKTWRVWIFWIAVLIAISFVLESSKSFQSCVKKAQYEAGEQTLKKRISDFSVLLRQRRDCVGAFVHRNGEAITALATILIASFTFVLWDSTNKLWAVTQETLGHNRETAERQMRAYVYLDITLTPYPPAPQRPNRLSVSLEIKNGGTTWARNVRSRHGSAINPTTSDPFDATPWDNIQASPIAIGPGQTHKMQFRDITQMHLTEITNGNMEVYFCAWVTYEDIFGGRRQTQLSRKFDADAEGSVALHYMSTHNCADEDCPA